MTESFLTNANIDLLTLLIDTSTNKPTHSKLTSFHSIPFIHYEHAFIACEAVSHIYTTLRTQNKSKLVMN